MKGSTIRMLGAGGHGKIAVEAWRSNGGKVIGFYDDNAKLRGQSVLAIPVAGGLAAAIEGQGLLHIAIGNNEARRRIAAGLADERFPAVAHVAAIISPTAEVGAGSLVCAGAVVQADARIGRHAIVNTAAVIEHDVIVGEFVHIAPGARIGGGVRIRDGTLVGLGAIILPGIEVGKNTTIGAGAVVTSDVEAGMIVAGNPARPLQRSAKQS